MTKRLDGLDLARFLAFVGMAIVNFKIAMSADAKGEGILSILTAALEGRAAATFVVLAGIGLGLAAIRSEHSQTVSVTFKRAAFLLVIGLLNSLIFDADILHYYAFYFLFGVFCLPLSTRSLVATIGAINIVFLVMLFTLNYDAGWNWNDYTYSGFWTPSGFVRNLFFNGWHPVFPWLSFLLFGIVLSRLPLHEERFQNRMMIWGVAVFVVTEIVSYLLTDSLAQGDAELSALLGTEPVPPMPLYMIAGVSIATAVVGICLRTSDWFESVGVLGFVTPAGRQTLTLYIAHILVGMGTLEALNLLGGQPLSTAVLASLIFCALATVYAFVWAKLFKRGPIEAVMRKVAG
jgi:uncharacterized membrane protein YeiB